MTRRDLLRAALSATALAAIDPELLDWEPGKRLISIPARRISIWQGDLMLYDGHVVQAAMSVCGSSDSGFMVDVWPRFRPAPNATSYADGKMVGPLSLVEANLAVEGFAKTMRNAGITPFMLARAMFPGLT